MAIERTTTEKGGVDRVRRDLASNFSDKAFDLWAVINTAEARLAELRVNGNTDEDSLSQVGRVLRVAAQLAYAIGSDAGNQRLEAGHA